jgi:hypothetical protein
MNTKCLYSKSTIYKYIYLFMYKFACFGFKNHLIPILVFPYTKTTERSYASINIYIWINFYLYMNILFNDIIDTNRIELGKIFSVSIRFV